MTAENRKKRMQHYINTGQKERAEKLKSQFPEEFATETKTAKSKKS